MAKDNQNPLNDSLLNKINSKIDLPLFIVVITASLYFIGTGFYGSFFLELSIPTRFINIEQSDYFIAGFMPVMLIGVFIAIFFKFWSQEPRNRMDALYCNQLFIIICLLLLLFFKLDNTTTDTLSKNVRYITSNIVLFAMGVLILATLFKFSMGYIIYKEGIFAKIVFVFFLILGLSYVAGLIGIYSAQNLIQEKGNTFEIQFSFKDKTENPLQNKTFIYVMQLNNNYYVMEKNQTAPINYIIPIEQTEYAKIYKAIDITNTSDNR